MNDKEWEELAHFLQARLMEHGLHDIADLSAYEDSEADGKRRFLDGRKLVEAMLETFRRHLVLNSQETLEESLGRIQDCVKGGGRLNQALVHFDSELARAEESEPVPVATLGRMTAAIGDLDSLKATLIEDPGEPGPKSDGGVDGPGH